MNWDNASLRDIFYYLFAAEKGNTKILVYKSILTSLSHEFMVNIEREEFFEIPQHCQ